MSKTRKFGSQEYRDHMSKVAKENGFGGNTTVQRWYSDDEIGELVDRYINLDCENTYKSIFTDKVYDTFTKWKMDVGRRLDEDSRKRFHYQKDVRSNARRRCVDCDVLLIEENHKGPVGFVKRCPGCLSIGSWLRGKDKDPTRGLNISKSKKAFYRSKKGKEVATTIGKKNSIRMKAFNKTPKGRENIERSKKRNSVLMKDKIAKGEFTPARRNSRTHWTAEYNGQKFRSSWEAMWTAIYPDHLYETIRVPYTFKGSSHTYIVDFEDRENKIAYEIKPEEHANDQRVLAKEKAAVEWCKENGYEYKIATQKDIAIHEEFLLSSDLPENIKDRVRIMCKK